jgi:histidine transport system substrate-binding protein
MLSAPAAAEELVIGITSTARPFTFNDEQGRMTGFNVELAHQLCTRLKATCRLDPGSFPQLLSGLADGSIQIGIGNLLKTPEREEKMLFSRPIWRSTSSFIGRKTLGRVSPERIRQSHPVCAVQKTQQAAWLAARPGPAGHLLEFPTFREVFDALAEGRCALAFMPTLGGLDFLASPRGRDFDYFGPPLRDDGLGGTVHLAIIRSRPDLRVAVDAALEKMSLDGSYRFLISRYFPFDIQ